MTEERVERASLPREERATLQADVIGADRGRGPRAFDVLAINAGTGNGLVYSSEVLEASLRLFDGVSVFVDHPSMDEWFGATGNRSLRNLLGVLHSVSWDSFLQGIRGKLTVFPGEPAGWFLPMVDEYLVAVQNGEDVPRVGLSAVLDVKAKGREVVSIDRVISVDAVFDPARGGQFIRALNQRREQEQEQEQASQEARDREGTAVEEEAQYVVNQQSAPEAQQQEATPAAAPAVPASRGARDASTDRPAEGALAGTVEAMQLMMGEMVLDTRLRQTQLPQGLQDLVRAQFSGRALRMDQLDATIEALQSAWAQSVAESQAAVRNVGHSGISVGLDEGDRLTAVMERLVGLTPRSEALQGVRPVSGIRELYLMLTGDYDFTGAYHPDRVHLANVTTATMTSLVKNAFNKVILDYFNQVDRWWEPIASHEDFDSMKQLTLITLGGFENLPTVSEGAAYTELSWSDAEETVDFVKKGAYVGVTLEMMDKDETRKFRAIPRKIAMAGYRTLGAVVSALFTDNSGVGPYWPSSQSTYRLFDASYGNLGSSALSASTWDAAIQAMYEQAEATSSAVMGIRPRYLMVPIELEKTALTIMESRGEPGTADNDANVRYRSSSVIVCPLWTDADNWAAIADPNVWPGIVIGYRYGRTPEVFIAGEETVGSMFTNDEMRIKARWIFAVGVGDYRPLYKANV